MIRKSVTATLMKREKKTNDYNEILESWVDNGTIEIIITTSTGSTETMNDVMSIASTHVGFTKSADVVAQDKIVVGNDSYIVDYVTPVRVGFLLSLQKASNV